MGLLTPMIERHLLDKQLQNQRLMRGKLHPSTIGMCQRRIVFDMMFVPKNFDDPQLIRIFENGHSMHHRYESWFAEIGILVEAEMKLERENISGHTDSLVKLQAFGQPQGDYYLIELKSAFSKSFDWMKKNNVAKQEHQAQLMFYMHLSGVHKGIILVENKDDQELWEYEMEYDPQWGLQLEQRANWLIDLAQKRELPPRPNKFTPSFYKCKECPYNIYCHGDSFKNDGEIRYPLPFNEGSQLYVQALQIAGAVQRGETIPDVIEGYTSGELFQEVTRKNETYLTVNQSPW